MNIFIAIIVGYIFLKIVFGKRKPKGIQIGMSSKNVQRIIGAPVKSDGRTIKENYEKDVLYYGEFLNEDNKKQYKYKVIYVNGKVTEIHEY